MLTVSLSRLLLPYIGSHSSIFFLYYSFFFRQKKKKKKHSKHLQLAGGAVEIFTSPAVSSLYTSGTFPSHLLLLFKFRAKRKETDAKRKRGYDANGDTRRGFAFFFWKIISNKENPKVLSMDVVSYIISPSKSRSMTTHIHPTPHSLLPSFLLIFVSYSWRCIMEGFIP